MVVVEVEDEETRVVDDEETRVVDDEPNVVVVVVGAGANVNVKFFETDAYAPVTFTVPVLPPKRLL